MSMPTAQTVASPGEHPGNKVYQDEEKIGSEDDVGNSDDELIEEEVTDDEGEFADSLVAPISATAASASATNIATTKTAGTLEKVSKVNPSSAVKNMQMRTPSGDLSSFPSHQNPLTEFRNWNKAAFKEVVVNFPILTTKQETTNALTREKAPETRYWKGVIEFAAKGWTSRTITINNVAIPFSDNKSYGSNFVYMSLPGYMAGRFGECGKDRRPTIVNEDSLMPDVERWWKPVNKVAGKFGVAIKDTNTFRATSLETILDSTQKGIICNVELQFFAKATTTDNAPLSPKDPQRVSVELIRAYIIQMDVDVQPPTRKPKISGQPSASKSGAENYAPDSLLAKLKALGL